MTLTSPIFIVGCGHSGTTLMLSILGSHSQLYAIPYESWLFHRSATEQSQYVQRFETETNAAGKNRWVEKTPRHILDLTQIFATFVDARVILMMRDGRDVACSLRARTGDLQAGTQRWLHDNAAADPFRNREDVLVVKYEDLIRAPEATLRVVMLFLGAEFEPELMQHHCADFRFYGGLDGMERYRAQIDALEEQPDDVTGENHRLYRSWQARQPIFDGRGRWRTQLSHGERAQLRDMAGAALIQYGYEDDNDWS
ncbi:MAG: sulfotransferase [Planctomycetota bacterium]